VLRFWVPTAAPLLDLAERITFGSWREPFSSFMALVNLADGEARCIGSR
jgi:hypothetical protein